MASDSKSECCDMAVACCIACNIGLFTMGIIGSCIAYIVFGIMFLINDYNIAMDCNDSSLWAYSLVGVIMTFTNVSAAKNAKKEDKSPCEFLVLGIIYTSLAVWGGVEIWEKTCNDLEETKLYKFAIATFSLHVFGASLCLIVVPCFIASMAIYQSKDKPNKLIIENPV